MRVASAELQTALDLNISGDKAGLPDWSSHFGSPAFTQSAVEHVIPHVLDTYSDKRLSVVSICGGVAFYERGIAQELSERGKEVDLTIYDLQEGSLSQVPNNEGGVKITKVNADVTHPLDATRIYSANRIVASRAFEHYLEAEGLEASHRNIAEIMMPGQLYFPNVSSGSRCALDSLAKATEILAGKSERFLTVDQYRGVIEGMTLFEEKALHFAETQTGRGAEAQARRYLNNKFFERHALRGMKKGVAYQKEMAGIIEIKQEVGQEVQAGELTREEGMAIIDNRIAETSIFSKFKGIYLEAVLPVAQQDKDAVDVHITEDQSGSPSDVILDISYPLFVLQKQ